MNKHGFPGVRKRTDGRARPYYARFRLNGECLYSKSHDSAEAAAKEYERYAAARTDHTLTSHMSKTGISTP